MSFNTTPPIGPKSEGVSLHRSHAKKKTSPSSKLATQVLSHSSLNKASDQNHSFTDTPPTISKQIAKTGSELVLKRKNPGSYEERAEALIQARANALIHFLALEELPLLTLLQTLACNPNEVLLFSIKGGGPLENSDFKRIDFIVDKKEKFIIAPAKHRENILNLKEQFSDAFRIDLTDYNTHYVEDNSWDAITEFLHEVSKIRAQAPFIEESKRKQIKRETRYDGNLLSREIRAPIFHFKKSKGEKEYSTRREIQSENEIQEQKKDEEAYKKEREIIKDHYIDEKRQQWLKGDLNKEEIKKRRKTNP